MARDTEITLLARAAAGDAQAFGTLFDAHRDAVFRLARHLTGRLDAAEDVAQECFLRLVRNPGGFDSARGSLRRYLYGMVRNLARQRWEADGRDLPLDDDPDDAPAALITPADEGIAQADIASAVQAAIARLPLLQREALVLFEFEELSLEEIARVAGTDVGAIKSRLYRARERLRHSLAAYGKETRSA